MLTGIEVEEFGEVFEERSFDFAQDSNGGAATGGTESTEGR